jgi:uncharacterized damage-inducible protein DinB
MPSSLIAPGLHALNFGRRATLGYFEDIPDDKLCFQACPGANHALWVLGHLAMTDEYFLDNVGGKPRNKFDAWEKKFFMGSKPTPSPADYPPASEVKQVLDQNRRTLLDWFGGMSDAELVRPIEGDMGQFAPTRAALVSTIAWHEGMHAGQLTVIRKSLGIAPKFG